MATQLSTMSPVLFPTFRSRPLKASNCVYQRLSTVRVLRNPFACGRSLVTHSAGKRPTRASYLNHLYQQSSGFSRSRNKTLNDKHFQISEEVKHAVASNQPVVALETTIYTHGFPYPDNVDLALGLEDVVRRSGGIPATIGIINGIARVGLTKDELTALASAAGKPQTMKVSRRDLPYILGMGIAGDKLNGGTTIAGTMFLARQAGIRVFGTGGLGGVHRGGHDTMDVSADLTELGRTAVAVISSGCKSFLDIPRTLEYLETQGVGVFTFADGRTGNIDFPAFYTRDSGVPSPMIVQNAREAAAMIYSQELFPHSSGLFFANPIPEEHSIPKADIDFAIDQAVKEAAERGFHGHANTPFILSRIKDLTKGNSITANRALICSNVTIATQVAVELSRLRSEHEGTRSDRVRARVLGETFTTAAPEVEPTTETLDEIGSPEILVFGSVAVDLSCDYAPPRQKSAADSSNSNIDVLPQMHTSNLASITPSIGGVGHNLTLAAHRAAGKPSVRIHSLVAQDLAGSTITTALKDEGLNTSGISIVPTHTTGSTGSNRTAQYVSINDAEKNLVIAMADMELFNGPDSHKYLPSEVASSVKWIIVDANWDPKTSRKILSRYKAANIKTAFEPVSVAKSARIFQSLPSSNDKTPLGVFPNHVVDLATPNKNELASMYAAAVKYEYFETANWWHVVDSLGIPSSGARDRFVALTNCDLTDAGIPLQSIQLLPFMPTILTKLGSQGVLMTALLTPDDTRLADPAAAPYILSRSSNGSMEVGGVYMRLFPALEVPGEVVSVNGVGDTFLGVLVAGLARNLPLGEDLIDIAQRGAVMTLMSNEAVSPSVAALAAELDALCR